MPIPRIVRQWNKAGLNRVTKHIAPWAPAWEWSSIAVGAPAACIRHRSTCSPPMTGMSSP